MPRASTSSELVVGTVLQCILGPEDQRAHFARRAPSTVHHAQVVFGHLAWARATHDLSCAFDHVAKASGEEGLPRGELSAVGVDREATLVCRVGRLLEGADLALFHESSVFEAHGHEDRVSIVELGELHVPRTVARHLEGPGSRDFDRCRRDAVGLPDADAALLHPHPKQVNRPLGMDLARSARVIISAAAPSQGMTHSSSRRG